MRLRDDDEIPPAATRAGIAEVSRRLPSKPTKLILPASLPETRTKPTVGCGCPTSCVVTSCSRIARRMLDRVTPASPAPPARQPIGKPRRKPAIPQPGATTQPPRQDPMHQSVAERRCTGRRRHWQNPMHQNGSALIARLPAHVSDCRKDPMHQNGSEPITPAHADMHRADLMQREERLAMMRRLCLPRFHKADRRSSRVSKKIQPQMHADARRWGRRPSRSSAAEIAWPDEPRSLGVQGSICVYRRASAVESSCFLASRTPQRIKPRVPNDKTPCTYQDPMRLYRPCQARTCSAIAGHPVQHHPSAPGQNPMHLYNPPSHRPQSRFA
jgi:hypothetical protein